jgi:hypothetical protein
VLIIPPGTAAPDNAATPAGSTPPPAESTTPPQGKP